MGGVEISDEEGNYKSASLTLDVRDTGQQQQMIQFLANFFYKQLGTHLELTGPAYLTCQRWCDRSARCQAPLSKVSGRLNAQPITATCQWKSHPL